MKNRLKNIFSNYKIILKNFGYLSLMQLFILILPLVSYPYLIRVLGAEIFGTVVFAQAVVMYFTILINFGFNISATKHVAVQKNNSSKLNEIVSAVISIKFFLWLISFFLLVALILLFPFFKENWLLLIVTFGITFSDFIFPLWYFQGVDKMKYITIINIFTRVLFTILIFVFIKTEEDYLLVPLFQFIGAILAGCISLWILLYKEKIILSIQKRSILKKYFYDSIPLFISAASVQIYVNANRVLVGSFLGMTEVAYYDLGEKILRLIKLPVGMLGQSAFPTLAREKNINKINKIMYIGVTITIVLIMIVFLFSNEIVVLLGGNQMKPSITVMRILSLSAIMVAFSQFLGTSRLIIFGFKKNFTQIIASSGIVFCIGALLLYISKTTTIISLAMLALSVEVWVTGLMFYINYKKKLLI